VIDRSGFLREITSRDPHLGMLLEDLFNGVDGVSNQLGVSPTHKVQPPDPIKAINVKAGTDHVHVTLTDTSQVKKGINYFVEWSVNDPSFANPHPEHLVAGRGRMLALPAKDDSGVRINYYFKGYSQYAGSDAQSKHAIFGGQYTPTPVQLTGNSQMTPLASKGSGTAAPDGSQGGKGLGTDLQRLPQGPKIPVPQRAF
jgi:hypothetical protein